MRSVKLPCPWQWPTAPELEKCAGRRQGPSPLFRVVLAMVLAESTVGALGITGETLGIAVLGVQSGRPAGAP